MPTPEAWQELDAADGATLRRRRAAPAAPGHAAQAHLHRPQLPRPRGGVRAADPRGAGHLRQVADLDHRARRRDRDPARGDPAGLRGRARPGHRPPRDAARPAPTPSRRSAASPRVHDVSGRRGQLETPLRQFTWGKSFDTFAPMGPAITRTDGLDLVEPRHQGHRLRRDDAGLEHDEPDLRPRAARRVLLDGHDARARRRHRHRHARRRRRRQEAAALPARGRHLSRSGSSTWGRWSTRSSTSAERRAMERIHGRRPRACASRRSRTGRRTGRWPSACTASPTRRIPGATCCRRWPRRATAPSRRGCAATPRRAPRPTAATSSARIGEDANGLHAALGGGRARGADRPRLGRVGGLPRAAGGARALVARGGDRRAADGRRHRPLVRAADAPQLVLVPAAAAEWPRRR